MEQSHWVRREGEKEGRRVGWRLRDISSKLPTVLLYFHCSLLQSRNLTQMKSSRATVWLPGAELPPLVYLPQLPWWLQPHCWRSAHTGGVVINKPAVSLCFSHHIHLSTFSCFPVRSGNPDCQFIVDTLWGCWLVCWLVVSCPGVCSLRTCNCSGWFFKNWWSSEVKGHEEEQPVHSSCFFLSLLVFMTSSLSTRFACFLTFFSPGHIFLPLWTISLQVEHIRPPLRGHVITHYTTDIHPDRPTDRQYCRSESAPVRLTPINLML